MTERGAGGDEVSDCSWHEARRRAEASVGPVAARRVPLGEACGGVLACDVRALSDLPESDVSAMDGWAVSGPPPWTLTGSVLAGDLPAPLSPGTAAVIATGAMVPSGADGVLRRERGEVIAGQLLPAVDATDLPPSLGDTRRRGSECRVRDLLLSAGTTVTPAGVGLIAAAGHDQVEIRRPTVDLFVLGDELLRSGPARAGRLRDALGPMLCLWLPRLGFLVQTCAHVPDSADALSKALHDSSADAVVTTGSTARGPVDHLHSVLARLGATLIVDGVAVRPGHPQVLALLPDGRPVVGLPGNPLAAVSGMFTLLQPLGRSLSSAIAPEPRTGPLLENVAAGTQATRLIPVLDGRPVLFAGPGMLRGLAHADSLAVVPPGGAPAGQEVQLISLP